MNLDVFVHKLKVKIGKATSSEIPMEYKSLRETIAKIDGVPPKVYKALTKFCQKYEKACKAQQALGETLSSLALEEPDTDIGEIMLKTGEAIKSLSTIQHAMLVNHIDKVVKPLQKFETRIKQSKDLDSAFVTKQHELDSCMNRLESIPDSAAESSRSLGLKTQLEDSFNAALETTKEVLSEKKSNFASNICQILLNFHHCYNESIIVTNDHKPVFEDAQKKKFKSEKKEEPKKEQPKKEEPKKEEVKKEPVLVAPITNVDNKSPRSGTSKPPPPKHAPKDSPQKIEKDLPICVPLYPYQAQGSDELSLDLNQVIKIHKKEGDGWWLGEHNGKKGVFPENYVKQVVPFTTKALYDYPPQESGELGLKTGQSITVYMKNPDGWWLGSVNNNTGIFPGNYTEAGQ